MIRTRRLFLAATLSLLASGAALADTLKRGVIEVWSNGEANRFSIEIADEPAERSRGLMFRYSMPDDAGMLFIYESDRIASFWMKNTYIPLDMLFITHDGIITRIAKQVQPHSLTSVRSDQPVRAVLEINGGLSDTLGIKAGDTVLLYH